MIPRRLYQRPNLLFSSIFSTKEWTLHYVRSYSATPVVLHKFMRLLERVKTKHIADPNMLRKLSARMKAEKLTIGDLAKACRYTKYIPPEHVDEVVPFVLQCLQRMEELLHQNKELLVVATDIASISLAIKSLNNDSKELRKILQFMETQLARSDVNCIVSNKHMCRILHGLQGLSVDIPGVVSLIDKVMEKPVKRGALSANFIWAACYELRFRHGA